MKMFRNKKNKVFKLLILLLVVASVISCTKHEESIKNDIVQIFGFKDKTGMLHRQGMLINGKKDGLWTEYNNDNSILCITEYKNGINSGIEILFYDNGNICGIGNNKNGKKEGRWIIFQSSNFHKIASEEYYLNGKATGIWKKYDQFGFLRKDYDYITKKTIREYGLIHSKPFPIPAKNKDSQDTTVVSVH